MHHPPFFIISQKSSPISSSLPYSTSPSNWAPTVLTMSTFPSTPPFPLSSPPSLSLPKKSGGTVLTLTTISTPFPLHHLPLPPSILPSFSPFSPFRSKVRIKSQVRSRLVVGVRPMIWIMIKTMINQLGRKLG